MQSFSDPFAKFETAHLSNGLTVRFQHFPVPFVFCRFLVHVGAREDPPELGGLNHLLEHLVTDNIPNMTNRQMRFQFIEWGEAAYLGEFGYLGTWFGFRTPNDLSILRRALDIYSSFLLGAKIERFIEEQRSTLINEFFDESELRFMRELDAKGMQIQFPGLGLGVYQGEFGTLESMLAINQPQLQRHYDCFYTPPNLEVVAAGGVDIQTLLKLLADSSFGQVKPGKRNPVLPALDPPAPLDTFYSTSLSRRERVVAPGQLEMVKYFSRGVLPGWIQYEAAQLFARMLEEVMYQSLREDLQLTYGFVPDLRFRQEFHFLEIVGFVPIPAAGKICDLVNRCILTAASDRALFHKFRTGELAAISMHDTSVADLVRDVVHRLRIWQRIPTLTENLVNYENLTPNDMQTIAERLLSNRRWTYVIEP